MKKDKVGFDEITIENLSHYLKTPFSIVLGYCDILLGGMAGDVSDEQTEYIEKIRSEVIKADKFLNSFLENVENDFKRSFGTVNRTDLNEMLRNIFLVFYVQAEKKGIYPDFILLERPFYIECAENTDKALLIILNSFTDYMESDQRLILEFKAKAGRLFSIGAAHNRYKKELSGIFREFTFVTAEKILGLSKISVKLEDNQIVFYCKEDTHD
ncbi:MAG: sensor histidine kinase [Candidatus Muiribacteriaceae bacterium]